MENFVLIGCIVFCAFGASQSSPLLSNTILIDEPQFQDDVIDLTRLGTVLFSEPDESVGLAVRSWSPRDRVNPEELGSYVEGDMLIPRVDGRNGIVQTSRRWSNGVVPYVFSSSLSNSDVNIISAAIAEYHRSTCIRFVPRSNERDYISFENSNTGCWSSVGKVGDKQQVNLQSPGCTTKVGTPIHEIMHALGFLHEQNRADRDNYIRIQYQNIKPETSPNFDKAQHGETTDFGVPYDTSSVMHYSSTAFSHNGQRTIIALNGDDPRMGQRDGFKFSDVAKINAMYNCDNVVPSSLGGDASRPTSTYNPGSPATPGTNPKPLTNPVAVAISNVASFLQHLG